MRTRPALLIFLFTINLPALSFAQAQELEVTDFGHSRGAYQLLSPGWLEYGGFSNKGAQESIVKATYRFSNGSNPTASFTIITVYDGPTVVDTYGYIQNWPAPGWFPPACCGCPSGPIFTAELPVACLPDPSSATYILRDTETKTDYDQILSRHDADLTHLQTDLWGTSCLEDGDYGKDFTQFMDEAPDQNKFVITRYICAGGQDMLLGKYTSDNDLIWATQMKNKPDYQNSQLPIQVVGNHLGGAVVLEKETNSMLYRFSWVSSAGVTTLSRSFKLSANKSGNAQFNKIPQWMHMAIDENGKIFVVGKVQLDNGGSAVNQIVVASITSSGAIDKIQSFKVTGKHLNPRRIVLTEDNTAVILGSIANSSNQNGGVVLKINRSTLDKVWDYTWAGDNECAMDLAIRAYAPDPLTAPTLEYWITGHTLQGTTPTDLFLNPFLFRISPSGALLSGRAMYPHEGTQDLPQNLLMSMSGPIITGGYNDDFNWHYLLHPNFEFFTCDAATFNPVWVSLGSVQQNPAITENPEAYYSFNVTPKMRRVQWIPDTSPGECENCQCDPITQH